MERFLLKARDTLRFTKEAIVHRGAEQTMPLDKWMIKGFYDPAVVTIPMISDYDIVENAERILAHENRKREKRRAAKEVGSLLLAAGMVGGILGGIIYMENQFDPINNPPSEPFPDNNPVIRDLQPENSAPVHKGNSRVITVYSKNKIIKQYNFPLNAKG